MPPDGVGTDPTICVGQFVAAMEVEILNDPAVPPEEAQRLIENLAKPEVQRNLMPLARAVHRILTIDAAPESRPADDGAFWGWLIGTASWISSMNQWRAGITSAFSTWVPATPAEASLRNAVLAVPPPGPPPSPVPGSLRGRVT